MTAYVPLPLSDRTSEVGHTMVRDVLRGPGMEPCHSQVEQSTAVVVAHSPAAEAGSVALAIRQ